MTSSIFSARPGLTRDVRSEAHEARDLYGLARYLCGPARGVEGPAHVSPPVLRCARRCWSYLVLIIVS